MLERIASMSPRAAGERPAQVSGTGTIAAAAATLLPAALLCRPASALPAAHQVQHTAGTTAYELLQYDRSCRTQERVAAAPRRALAGEDHTRPSERVLQLWQTASAVCFDVDCTVANNDQLDLLAEWMGVGQQVAALTNSVSRAAAAE